MPAAWSSFFSLATKSLMNESDGTQKQLKHISSLRIYVFKEVQQIQKVQQVGPVGVLETVCRTKVLAINVFCKYFEASDAVRTC